MMFPEQPTQPHLTKSEAEKYVTCTDAAATLKPMYGRWFLWDAIDGTVPSFMLRGKRCVRKELFTEWCTRTQEGLDNPSPLSKEMREAWERAKAENARKRAESEQAAKTATPHANTGSEPIDSPPVEKPDNEAPAAEGPAKPPVEEGPAEYITYQDALQFHDVNRRALNTAIRYTVLKTKKENGRTMILKSSFERWFKLGGPKAAWLKRLYRAGPPKPPKPKPEASPVQPPDTPKPAVVPQNPYWIYKE